jgi:cell wall-associated NlpC family hydrolase
MRLFLLTASLLLALHAHAAPQLDPSEDPHTGTLIVEKTLMGQFHQVRQTVADRTSDLVVTAIGFLGVPYRRGGNTAETGFDCSGFVRAMYTQTVGHLLPRRAEEQAAATEKIDRSELKPGDLVFFNTLKRTFSHVGIYLGDDKFIHAPRSGAEVRIESLDVKYWAKRFTGARRADPAVTAVVAPASVAPVAAPGENPTAP